MAGYIDVEDNPTIKHLMILGPPTSLTTWADNYVKGTIVFDPKKILLDCKALIDQDAEGWGCASQVLDNAKYYLDSPETFPSYCSAAKALFDVLDAPADPQAILTKIFSGMEYGDLGQGIVGNAKFYLANPEVFSAGNSSVEVYFTKLKEIEIADAVAVLQNAIDTPQLYAEKWANAILESALSYLCTDTPNTAAEYNTAKFFLSNVKPTKIPKHLVDASALVKDAYNNVDDDSATGKQTLRVLNKVWCLIRKATGEYDGNAMTPNTVRTLIGPSVPVEWVEGMDKCEGGDHKLHSCGCLLASECGCIVDTDEGEGVCSACNNCLSCCEEDGECYECPSCEERVDSSGNHQCECCKCCEECCSNAGECFYCEGCDTTKNSSCSNCDKCNACCNCWTCMACNESFSLGGDAFQCEYCERCNECCNCHVCASCDKKIPKGSSNWCEDCSNCMGCCECTWVKKILTCSSCEAAIARVCGNPGCRRCEHCCCHGGNSYAVSFAPQTQKAKGIKALAQQWGSAFNVPSFYLLRAKEAAGSVGRLVGRFVRPCPMTPRHGFVDSRVVKTEEEAIAIINETLAADPQAELISMPPIYATHSAVWSPGVFIIGPGNDGATAGHGSHTIAIGGNFLYGCVGLLEAAGITQAPYVEMLWSEKGYGKEFGASPDPIFHGVQLRDGPKVPQQVDYVAEQMVVDNVIVAEGDLLAWETLMKNQPAGTVVYHPGGSLASHYAVHAMLNHIPVVVSHQPKKGDILLPVSGNAASTPDMAAIRTGFYYGLNANMSVRVAAYMMLLGCHSTVLWLGHHDYLLGVALGSCYRLTITAALGEWRYKKHLKTGDSVGPRTDQYAMTWMKVRRLGGLFTHALKDFRTLNWQGAIGGENWFQFTHWAAVMYNAVRKGNATQALEAMNKAVNASHNSGWGFNKFVPNSAMTLVANNPVYAVRFCGALMHDALSAQDATAEKARMWFRNHKPYPTFKMDKWLDVPVPLDVAQRVQVRLEHDKIIALAQMGNNSKLRQRHVIPVPEDLLPDVTEVFAARMSLYGVPSPIEGDSYRYLEPLLGNSGGIGKSGFQCFKVAHSVGGKLKTVLIPLNYTNEVIHVNK